MEILAKIVAGVTLIVLIVVLFSLPTWLLWNGLMPVIFGLPEITLPQAIGLSFLARFLLGTGVQASSSK